MINLNMFQYKKLDITNYVYKLLDAKIGLCIYTYALLLLLFICILQYHVPMSFLRNWHVLCPGRTCVPCPCL